MSLRDRQSSTAAPSPPIEAIQALIPDIPEVLEFESWWIGHDGNKRYMLILYFTALKQFQILADDSKVPLTIGVMDRTGESLRAWDLHVGATIDILGRPTTLMSCTLRTMRWLADNSRRLWKVKEALERRVNKFRAVPSVTLTAGMFKRMTTSTAALGGTVHLGRIATCVHSLELELRHYQ